MTLEEAIKHCKEKAEEKRRDYEQTCAYNISSEGCLKCAEEHEQLAEWLEELKDWRIREEMSKKDRATIIIQGEKLFLTDGHIKALIDYENEQSIRRATQDILNDMTDFNKEIVEEYKYTGKEFDNKEKE